MAATRYKHAMPPVAAGSGKLAGRVAVITGASMGIGEALAQEFAAHGASAVLTSRDLARAEQARARLGAPERTLAIACDVRKRDDIERLLQATVARFQRVDVWINNAGHGLLDSVSEMNMADCRALFETNLFGAVECMQAVVPVMKRQGGGTIINISSVAGHIAVPYMAAYSASKFALNAMGKAARLELKGTGVNVMTACPGYIATDFAANAMKGNDRQRIGVSKDRISPQRLARAVLKGYLKNRREVVCPWRDHIFIKLYQLFPFVIELGMKKMLRPADTVIAQSVRKGE